MNIKFFFISTPISKVRVKLALALLLALGVIVNSCQRNVDPPEDDKIYTLSEIANSKEWYDAYTFKKPLKATIFNEKTSSKIAREIKSLILAYSYIRMCSLISIVVYAS
jgi:hypothetical protein